MVTDPNRLTTRNLKQTVVYWGNPQPDGYGGYVFDAAVEISARWQDKQQLFVDRQGNEAVSRAVVYVDRDVDIGGYLYLGTLDDLDSVQEADPYDVSGAWPIRAFAKTPDITGEFFVRKVWI